MWPFSTSCEKNRRCGPCMANGCIFFFNPGKADPKTGYCVKAGATLDVVFTTKTKFPFARASADCPAAEAKSVATADYSALSATMRQTAKSGDLMAKVEQTLRDKYKGQNAFDSCPKDVFLLYLEQQKLEREFGFFTASVGTRNKL